MATAELRNLSGRDGDGVVLSPLHLRLGDGEMIALLGPPGAGKSLLLHLVAGLAAPSAGSVLIGPHAVDHLPAAERDVAMVFADGSLYPHKTVRGNIEFPLRTRRVARRARQEQVEYIAGLLALSDVLDAVPADLEPAAQQSVALARALVRSPALLLLDDPFARLTRRRREELRTRLRAVQRQLRVTTLLASDDAEEAMYLGDRIAVLRGGSLQQVDTPANVYAHPANAFVAGLAGSPPMNLIAATYRDGLIAIDEQRLPVPDTWGGLLGDGAAVLLGVRPECFELGGPARNRLSVVLDPTSRVVLGSRILVQGSVGDHAVTVELPGNALDLPRHAFARLDQTHLFARPSGERLNP